MSILTKAKRKEIDYHVLVSGWVTKQSDICKHIIYLSVFGMGVPFYLEDEMNTCQKITCFVSSLIFASAIVLSLICLYKDVKHFNTRSNVIVTNNKSKKKAVKDRADRQYEDIKMLNMLCLMLFSLGAISDIMFLLTTFL